VRGEASCGCRRGEAAAPLHVAAVRELFLDHVTPVELRTLAEISERVVAKLDQDAS
jgi:hypothetical protein